MRKVILIAVMLLAIVAVVAVPRPSFADSIPSNLELWDEMTIGGKIASTDLLLSTKYVDVGAEIGVMDFSNFTNSKGSAFAMATVNIKNVRILNRIFGWKQD